MDSRRTSVLVIEVVLVVVSGLWINAASEHFPGWMQDPVLVWVGLLALLLFMIAFTIAPVLADAVGSRPQVWNTPARNPNFTGRQEDLRRLRDLLKGNRTVAVHAVRGMGGVGKTQLAVEYCNWRAKDYDLVWWISAEDLALVPGQLAQLGKELGLVLSDNAAESVSAVMSALHNRDRWLLVFDNAETAEGIRPFIPTGSGHVLVTTRRSGFDAIGDVINLDILPRVRSIELVQRRAPAVSDSQAEELAELLGDLPLALEQAAAYLRQSNCPIDDYLDVLRRVPEAVAERGQDAHRRSHQNTLKTLWSVSLGWIDEHHPAAAQLLAVCAYLAPEAIPLDLFTDNANVLPEPLATAAASTSGDFSDVVGVLVDHSLVQRVDGQLVMHRVVQLAVRTHATLDPHPTAIAAALLRTALPSNLELEPKSWPRWRQMLPHVLAVVDHDQADALAEPATISWLLERAGSYLRELGQVADAKPLFERALAIEEGRHRPDDLRIAVRINNLGRVLYDLGQPSEAKPLFERALRLIEAEYGPDSPKVVPYRNSLASALLDLGRPAEARTLFERALGLVEADPDRDDYVRAACMNNLALALGDLGDAEGAASLLEQTLRITETSNGPEHITVAICLTNLAAAYCDLGRLIDAKPILERALTIREACYGPDHPATARALQNLAEVLGGLGEAAAARAARDRAQQIEDRQARR
ncbi:hypothetical protein Lesp02_20710 [Lentzea sp. NBRC 105346]|uniref:FxSxx-COOH system tetratricopeptide repeat protein n=1 Tax=Lentzea sp. NBRC 105346 TaxID=3032205 RepID=UPI0024A4CD85|nr:FxSxx-COOH system tetratricopeptide repeat protein [Lentzea sp. NBRC 105346]GLZ29881.1 hypothetical protein Lesp02_20710 [Lentzea sp. NBRC 105346]